MFPRVQHAYSRAEAAYWHSKPKTTHRLKTAVITRVTQRLETFRAELRHTEEAL